jgi:osmotically-inducible protein OsmY
MADRNDERSRGDEGRRDRGYGREYSRDDRGVIERAGDEVRSWFGDDEAERRRRMDEARYGRDWDRYGRDAERAYGRDMDDRMYGRDWDYGHRMGFDYGRAPRGRGEERFGYGNRFERYGNEPTYEYSRPVGARDWNEPAYYRSSYTAMGSYGNRGTSATGREFGEPGRQSQGWFAGRGPRGYQRSDERIREDVCDRLSDDPWVDATDVDVAVRGGEVTLSGHVRDRSDKRRIEDVIEDVSGVREVHNNLRAGSGWEGGTSREQGTTAGTTATPATTSRR